MITVEAPEFMAAQVTDISLCNDTVDFLVALQEKSWHQQLVSLASHMWRYSGADWARGNHEDDESLTVPSDLVSGDREHSRQSRLRCRCFV
ncbi:hypothetical protein JOB18_026308 [Solea senegalensis]|uniref:Uncharacterized protein n=1 Tax=Solea senegalensis TaxID=28829 RepID=A0AAV6T8D4_SOLSE|nr:hypothetical protein JOB18_026308 [Solea senegalensis]